MAMVLDAFMGNLVGKLMSLAGKELSMLRGVEDGVQKMQERLEILKGVLQDVEQKRYMDSRADTTFVNELKDVMYDADDIIDTCLMEGGKLLGRLERPTPVCSPAPFRMFSSCFHCLKYRHEVGLDIKKLNARIDQIVKHHKLIMGTTRMHTGQSSSNQHKVLSTRQTSPLQEDVKSIVGSKIKEAAESLINSIVEINDDGEAKCRIFAITGMGGIGKTTLASKVYNDNRITCRYHETSDEKMTFSNFYEPNDEKMITNFSSRRIWLHVSKDYSETELLKEIVRQLGGRDGGERSRAELDKKLTSLFHESLFLVLDDIWSTDVWYKLLSGPMKNTAKSLRILVTTRDEMVAKGLRASSVHHVDKMDHGSCWELLCNEVFEDGEEGGNHSFREIGYQIVEKCDGLPLAIKAIAGVLRQRDKSTTQWEKVLRQSEVWFMRKINDEVPSVLYLSYEDLSPELKQCFLYCSLISANGIMLRADLVSYWIDEGFVFVKEDSRSSSSSSSMEEVAEEWYRELVSRNLLQLDPHFVDGSRCTMHDHFQSLGQFLIEGEAICIKGNQRVCTSRSPSLKLRRLLMLSSTGETLKLPDGIKPKHLRTLFLLEGSRINSLGNDLIGQLCNLRILMLSDIKIEVIPNSIGDLFHLRQLDLDRTNIKKIPDSIGNLSNLQTLRAGGCQFLRQLPNTITSLRKLRTLHVDGSPLSHVPRGIGQLQNMRKIGGLIIGHDGDLGNKGKKGCDLDELQHLSNLRSLKLHKLQRSSGENAASALANKLFLEVLILSEEATSFNDAQIERAQVIYDNLTPPSSIQRLWICNFPGLDFPRWMMSPSLGDSFPNLTFLVLLNATLCSKLPPCLSQLPQLKFLHIERANAITTIGPQFFACNSRAVAFPNLEHLIFEKMPNWEEWWFKYKVDQVGSVGSKNVKMQLLPNLRELILDQCSKLKTLPECLSLATNLKKLVIKRARKLRKIGDLPLLSNDLFIENCNMLETLSNLPSLRHLIINDCSRLEFMYNLTALQRLSIETSGKHLPQWLRWLVKQPRFQKLDMRCSLNLLKDCLMNGPNWHVIQQIQDVNVRALREGMYMRYTKDPRYSYQTNAL